MQSGRLPSEYNLQLKKRCFSSLNDTQKSRLRWKAGSVSGILTKTINFFQISSLYKLKLKPRWHRSIIVDSVCGLFCCGAMSIHCANAYRETPKLYCIEMSTANSTVVTMKTVVIIQETLHLRRWCRSMIIIVTYYSDANGCKLIIRLAYESHTLTLIYYLSFTKF